MSAGLYIDQIIEQKYCKDIKLYLDQIRNGEITTLWFDSPGRQGTLWWCGCSASGIFWMFVAIYVVDIDVYILSVVVALSVCVVCGSETGHPILRLGGNVL